ncbi:MAG: hypothetical protein Q9162_006532 [Coniocarpon cinnabarinum]
MAEPHVTIDYALRLVPEPGGPTALLHRHLPAQPSLAHQADHNGYTLLHGAASYSTPTHAHSFELLRALVQIYHVSPNVRDSDGDTPLFYTESRESARVLVEELGADWSISNRVDLTTEMNARINAEEDYTGGFGEVAAYLREVRMEHAGGVNGVLSESGNGHTSTSGSPSEAQEQEEEETLAPPPPLPPGVTMNLETVPEASAEGEGAGQPDPEFRARIEALAAREDFQSEEGQAELRGLVEDAVQDLGMDGAGDGGGKRGRMS